LREAAGYQQATRARSLRDPYLAAARSGIGGAYWTKAWESRHSITFEDAIDYALERNADSWSNSREGDGT